MFKSGFVTIVGRPNVGKSTFLNFVLEQKIAIMSDKPQTTRNRIQGYYTTAEMQVIFIDTPGVHKPKHKLGEYMVNATQSSIAGQDLVLYLVDVTNFNKTAEGYLLEMLKEAKTPIIVVLNKIDVVTPEQLEEAKQYLEANLEFLDMVSISAIEGTNVPLLLDKIKENLPEGPLYYPEDEVTDQPEKQIISEMVREKILQLTEDEIPHSVVVETEKVREQDNGVVNVQANIYVERDSQKGIIIGKGGKMLKEIGSRARVEIEDLLGSKIFLQLWVKVKKDWRNKEMDLRNFGYDKRNL